MGSPYSDRKATLLVCETSKIQSWGGLVSFWSPVLSWLLFSMLWQIPAQSILREKGLGAHDLQAQSIAAGKSQHQGHEAAGHIVPQLGNRWRWTLVLGCPFPLIQLETPANGFTPPIPGLISLPQLIKPRGQPSQTCPEVCLHEDFRANNMDNQNYPSQCSLKILLYDSISIIIWESWG